MDEKYFKIAAVLSPIIGALVLGGSALYESRHPFYVEARQLFSEVKSEYDRDNNEIIDSVEGSRLLRDLNCTLPSQGDFTIEFCDGNRNRRQVYVRANGVKGKSRKLHRVPISRFRGLVRKTQKR